MAHAPRGASARPRSWKGAKSEKAPRPGVRRLKATFFSTLALILAAVLAWIVWPYIQPRPDLRVAWLAVPDYASLVAPVMPFQRAGLDAWKKSLQGARGVEIKEYENRTEAEDFQEFARDDLPSLATDERDCLVLCMSAHGIADDQGAYLLGSTFDPRGRGAGKPQGRFALAELLEGLARSPARLKLLILDAGRLNTDPWMGLVDNPFAEVVEKSVSELDDNRVWVLLSHGRGERSGVSYSDGWNAFQHFLADGLGGSADRNADGDLDLDEWWAYASRNVSAWVYAASGRNETQTPQILQGGTGAVAAALVPPGIFLMHLPPRREPKEDVSAPSEPESGEQSGDKNKDGAEGQNGSKAATPEKGSGQKSVRARGIPRSRLLDFGGPPSGLAMFWQNAQPQSPDAKSTAAGEQPAAGQAAPTPTQGEKAQPAQPDAGQAAAPAKDGDAPKQGDAAASPGGAKDAAGAEKAETPAKDGDAEGTPSAKSGEDSKKGDAKSPGKEDAPTDDAKEAPQLASLAALWEQWSWSWEQAGGAKSDGWRPVDVAPHLWREYRELLIAFEERQRAGLRPRLDIQEQRRAIERASERFHAGKARHAWTRPMVRKQAYQLRNELLDALPYYLRWFGEGYHAPDGELADALRELLADLPTFIRRLDGLPAPPAGAIDTVAAAREREGALDRDVQKLSQMRDTLARIVEREVSELLDNRPAAGRGNRIVALSRLPSISLADRRRLAATLAAGDPVQVEDPPTEDDIQRVRRTNARRLTTWMELSRSLIRLSPLEGGSVDEAGSRDSQASTPSRRPTGNPAIASDVAEFHAALPKHLERALAQKRDEPLRLLEPALRLADAREAPGLSELIDRQVERDPFTALVPIEYSPEPAPEVALDGPAGISGDEVVPLEFEKFKDLTWTLRVQAFPASRVRVAVDFDPALVEVQRAKSEIRPGDDGVQWFDVGPDTPPISLSYAVRARQERDGNLQEAALTVRALGRAESRMPIRFGLPASGLVSLVAMTSTGKELSALPAPAGAHRRLVLPIFTSGETAYSLGLRNPSRTAKPVKLQWLKLPAPAPNERRQKDWVWMGLEDDFDGFLANCEALGGPIEVSFEAGKADKPLPAAPPAATLPAQPPAAGAQNPTPPPAGDAPLDVTHGLLAVVEDVSRPDEQKRRAYWVDLVGRHPSEYLDEPEVTYDGKRLKIQVHAAAGKELPPAGSVVRWDVRLAGEERLREPDVEARVDRLNPDDVCGALVDPDGGTMKVFLDVDGYPRAFVYSVQLQRGGDTAEWLKNEYESVEIISPTKEDIYYRPMDALPVKLRVDARWERFAGGDAELEVVLGDRDRPQRRFSDRDIAFARLKPEGDVVKFVSTVKDWEVSVPTSGFQDQSVALVARLTGGKSDKRTIYLDGQKPVISVPPGVVSVVQGKFLDVRVSDDRADGQGSGIKEVKFGLDPEGTGKLEKGQGADLAPGSNTLYRIPIGEDMKPGPQTLLVQAVDRSGNEALATLKLSVKPPETTPPKTTNDIVVTVYYQGEPQSDAKVVLEGVGEKMSGPDGKCTFTEVEPGAYTLAATKNRGGVAREALKENIQVKPPPAKPTVVRLDLE